MKVEKFRYNGFVVSPPKGGWNQFESYTATFKEWTNDPGIVICTCSDNVERMIPTCCLHDVTEPLPIQDLTNKILFGTPCKS